MKMEENVKAKSGKARKAFLLPFSLLLFVFPARGEPVVTEDQQFKLVLPDGTAELFASRDAAVNAAGGTEVSVRPLNVRPGLCYGLRRSETPNGPFVVEEDGWVSADANGTLPRALTAPKVGPQGFYRVVVRDGR